MDDLAFKVARIEVTVAQHSEVISELNSRVQEHHDYIQQQRGALRFLVAVGLANVVSLIGLIFTLAKLLRQ